ncbi:MAG: 1-acyl-sn-glycerol-3-phosphate acyltransferase [Saprospiraceae bacterium]
MNPVMSLIYSILRRMVRLGLIIYYKPYCLLHRARISTSAPTIFVGNHPNTMMDVFHPIAFSQLKVKFLGNAGLFANPLLSRFFKLFYTIKIERPQDSPGKLINNEQAFQESIDHLKAKGNLYVAPEGSSYMNRQLRDVKTGTARIALWTAAQTNWSPDITILPVGISYQSPAQFRKGIVVSAAPILKVSDYRHRYHDDQQETVHQLTEDIEHALFAHSFSFMNEMDEIAIGGLIQSQLGEAIFYEANSFEKAINWRNQILAIKENDPEAFSKFEAEWLEWKSEVRKHKFSQFLLNPYNLKSKGIGQNLPPLLRNLLIIIGQIQYAVPTFLLRQIVKKIDPYIGYNSTFYFAGGLFIYPIFFKAQAYLLALLSGNWMLFWAYLIFAPLSSIIAHDLEAISADNLLLLACDRAKFDQEYIRLKGEKEALIGRYFPFITQE